MRTSSTAAVDLDPDPVELPLHRRAVERPTSPRPREAPVEASMGMIGRKISKPDAAEPLLPFGHRDLGRSRQIARQHQRTTRDLTGHAGGPGDGIGHHAGERTLPELTGEQPPQERGFRRGGAAEQVGEQDPARARRAGAGGALDLVDRPIDVCHCKRSVLGWVGIDAVHGRVADADPPLTRDAGQETDADRHLVRVELPQQLGEDRDLARPRARLADEPRCSDHVGQQRHAARSSRLVHRPFDLGRAHA